MINQRGKRKKADLPLTPPPAKASFRSTECLLLSLLRQGTCDETESPMRDVLGGKLQSRLAALKGGSAGAGPIGGSCTSLSTAGSMRYQTRSCSLETILDDSTPLTRQQLFMSTDSVISCTTHRSVANSLSKDTSFSSENASGCTTRSRLSVVSNGGQSVIQRPRPLRPHSVGSCLDIVMETREEDIKETKWQGRSASCLNVNTPAQQHCSSASQPPSLPSHPPPSSSFHPFSSSLLAMTKVQGPCSTTDTSGPKPTFSTSNLWTLAAPTAGRRCISSLDLSKLPRPASLFRPPVCVPFSSCKPLRPKPEHSKTLSPSTCLFLPVC